MTLSRHLVFLLLIWIGFATAYNISPSGRFTTRYTPWLFPLPHDSQPLLLVSNTDLGKNCSNSLSCTGIQTAAVSSFSLNSQVAFSVLEATLRLLTTPRYRTLASIVRLILSARMCGVIYMHVQKKVKDITVSTKTSCAIEISLACLLAVATSFPRLYNNGFAVSWWRDCRRGRNRRGWSIHSSTYFSWWVFSEACHSVVKCAQSFVNYVSHSKLLIGGASIANYIQMGPKRHPLADRPLISYNLALLMQPIALAGIFASNKTLAQ